MTNKEKLTDLEFQQMLQLLNSYMITEMDQWDAFKFNSEFGDMFIYLSMKPTADKHVDITKIIKEEK